MGGYPTLQITLAEIEAIELAADIAYHGGPRIESHEYMMLNALGTRFWARYEPVEDAYTEEDTHGKRETGDRERVSRSEDREVDGKTRRGRR